MTDTTDRHRRVPAARPGPGSRRTSSRGRTDATRARAATRPTPTSPPARALQRRLFDGGYAGISFPAEYGGRGLTAAHERAFREEAADYVTPDLGVAGGVTFGPIGRSLLAHATPEFLQRHIPKILSGRGDLVPVLLRARGRLGPRRHPHPSRCATVTTGSSTAPRSGARAPTTPTGRCAWPAPTGTCPKHRGLTWFAVPTDAEGVTIRQITQINGNAEFCEEFLDDVDRHRRRHHRRGQPGLVGHPDDARLRARRRRVGRRRARAARAGARPRRAGPPRRSDRRSGRPPGHRPGPHQRLRPVPPRSPDRRPPAGVGRRPTRPSPPTASSPPACSHPIRARLALEIGGSEALTWAEGDERRRAAGASTTSTGAISPSPPAPTRCSATASASACSGCPASRASTRPSRSTRCSDSPRAGAARSPEAVPPHPVAPLLARRPARMCRRSWRS